MNNNKLLLIIVERGKARKLVKKTTKSGATGATIILAEGFSAKHQTTFLGIPIKQEMEMVMIVSSTSNALNLIEKATATCSLNKPEHGLLFVLNVKEVSGVCHDCTLTDEDETEEMQLSLPKKYDLIITIVNKGESEKVLDSSEKAGAEGGTILIGRGSGIHEHAKIFGIAIEPEKEIVLTVIKSEITRSVLDRIVSECELNRPGKGIAFVIGIENVEGICHLEAEN